MISECQKDFFKALSQKNLISAQNDQTLNVQKNYHNEAIESEIILSIIKKAHYRAIKMRQELLPDIFNSNDNDYKFDDIILAIIQLEKASNQENKYEQYYLGEIYYLGQYISRDIDKSIHYLALSANRNNSNAQCQIGIIYYADKFISQDIDKSIYYLALSANQNNSESQYLLGKIYFFGEYISRDINKSIHFFTLSANQYN